MKVEARANRARFGDFQFDFKSRELRKLGVRLRLEDKPAQLLGLLLEVAPEVLTRTDLQNRLWPEDVYLDREHGLNKCINRLRTVLGDDPKEPLYIETLSRRGYRFVAAVEFSQEGPREASIEELVETEPPAAPTPHVSTRTPKARWVLASVAILLVAGLAVVMGYKWRRGAKFTGSASPPQSVVEKPVASVSIHTDYGMDPEKLGFQIKRFGFFEMLPSRNLETGAGDGVQLSTDNQGYYYHPLTEAEKDFALQRDWVLTCVCSLKSGGAFVEVDFGRSPKVPRFDIVLLKERGRYYVGLPKRVQPTVEWEAKLEFPGVSDRNHPHTYELRYNHVARTADLWIDGKLRKSGYTGEEQYVENHGLVLGVYNAHGEGDGVVVYNTVSFEAK